MALPKLQSITSLSVVGGIIVVFGLGFAVVGLQQQHQTKSNAYTDSKCASAGGTCQLVGSGCAGGFVDDYCPSQVESVKCCMPPTTSCVQHLHGRCLSKSARYDKCPSGGHFVAGYCPGGNDVQCCVVPTPTKVKEHLGKNPDDCDDDGSTGDRHGKPCNPGHNHASPQGCLHGEPDCLTPTLTATPTITPTPKLTATPTPTVTPTPQPLSTKVTFDLLFHGIGKGGDNRNPNGGGNPTPIHVQRLVTIELHNPTDNSLVLSKDAVAIYDASSGSFKIQAFDMGTTVASKVYLIRLISLPLRGKTLSAITAGITNVIPQFALVNGDVNGDGVLDIQDYNMIQGCVSDFGIAPTDCDSVRAAKADLDDDGKVTIFDMNLFIRELSVQQL